MRLIYLIVNFKESRKNEANLKCLRLIFLEQLKFLFQNPLPTPFLGVVKRKGKEKKGKKRTAASTFDDGTLLGN